MVPARHRDKKAGPAFAGKGLHPIGRVDPAKRSIVNIGFGSKIETEQFSETVIAASDKDSE
jgi:hypothetical protein